MTMTDDPRVTSRVDDTPSFAETEGRYREWVYRHPVAGAALAGFIATQIGTIWGYYGPGIGLPSLPFPAYNGALFSPASVAKDFSNFSNPSSWLVGQSVHYVNGIVFGMMFALLAYNKLPTFFAKGKSIQKGMFFGVTQTIIGLGFLFPYVYAPHSGFGIFSFGDNVLGTNHQHWKLPFAVLVWHLIYGALLGIFYNPKRPSDAV